MLTVLMTGQWPKHRCRTMAGPWGSWTDLARQFSLVIQYDIGSAGLGIFSVFILLYGYNCISTEDRWSGDWNGTTIGGGIVSVTADSLG